MKFKIISGIVLVIVLGGIYAVFGGQEQSTPSSARQSSEEAPSFSGIGK